jgi:peptidoglycan/LPS O-acetylase OafA/YrhL
MESKEIDSRKYFPNLDGLRFIGALFILVLHVEGIKRLHGGKVINTIWHFESLGYIAVCLFFVLSGFLITYLLLKEKQKTGTVNFRKYYIKRTLKIWPLHCFILILGFFILPYFFGFIGTFYSNKMYGHFWFNLFGSALFLSPLVIVTGGLPETIGAIWSVGVEEVFYLFWPLILKRTKNYLPVFIGIALAGLLINNGFLLMNNIISIPAGYTHFMIDIKVTLVRYAFGCMAIGGIGAYLVVFEKQKILSVIYRKDVQWVVYIVAVTMLILKVNLTGVRGENFPNISSELYSLFFCFFIINIATNPSSIVRFNYKWITYLGKISYGIYLYNPIMRIFSFELTKYLFHAEVSGLAMNLTLYGFTISFTILIAILSYEFFEKNFLNLRSKFTATPSQA